MGGSSQDPDPHPIGGRRGTFGRKELFFSTGVVT